jgi:hypothetical protein
MVVVEVLPFPLVVEDLGVVDHHPVQQVVVELGLELGAVIGLDDLDPKRQPLQHVVGELDGRLLVELAVDAQDAQPRAVVDGRELVMLAA